MWLPVYCVMSPARDCTALAPAKGSLSPTSHCCDPGVVFSFGKLNIEAEMIEAMEPWLNLLHLVNSETSADDPKDFVYAAVIVMLSD